MRLDTPEAGTVRGKIRSLILPWAAAASAV